MSLLGNMFAGGLVHGGKALHDQAAERERAEAQARLEAARQKAETDRAMALEALRAQRQKESDERQHGYAKERDEAGREFTLQRDQNTQQFTLDRDDRLHGRQMERDQADRDFRSSEGAKDRQSRLTAAGIAAGSRDKLVTGGDGLVYRMDGSGSLSPVMTPDGKQLTGQKNLDTGTLQYIDSLRTELRDPMTTPERKAEINKQIGQLTGHGQTGNGSAKAYPVPPSAAIDALKRNPKLSGDFEAKYGPEALASALKSGEPVNLGGGGLVNGKPEAKGERAEAKPKPDFAEPPKLSDRDLEQQREYDAQAERRRQSQARAAEIKAITPDRIKDMTAEEAKALLDKYGTELSGRQRAALNARLR